MLKNQFYVNTENTGYTIREVLHQGKPHIVVPVVMMVEGVHNGSQGPLLHTADELGKIPDSWNGIPVVINHPMNEEGVNISANSPEIIDGTTVGRVYHTKMNGVKLVAEAYLDKEKLENISPKALTSILLGEPLDVSIGVFTDEDAVQGVWNDEEYNSIAINHRPDHLALLPGGTGACSWNDGCGIRVNQKKEGGGSVEDVNLSIEDVSVTNGTVKRTKFNNNKGGKTMEDGAKPCGQCMEKVVAIINSNATHFTAEDREWLIAQDEAVLDKLMPKAPEKVVEVNTKAPELTSEQIIKAMSAEDRAALAYGRKQLAEKRETMIKGIQDNTSKELWPDAVLNTLSEDFLEKLHKSVQPAEEVVDYSLSGGFRKFEVTANSDEALYPTGVEIETKK